MAQEQTANWLSQLDSEEKIFASDQLSKTIAFLKAARVPGEGWGAYPKLGSDLHHTALALQALYYSRDKSVTATIADAALYVRKLKGEALSGLSLDDACDLLNIARVEQRPGDDEHLGHLLAALRQAYNAAAETGGGLSTHQLCAALLAVLELGRTDLEMVKPWSERLLGLQHPDGGWPTVNEEGSSVVATAMALQVLTRSSGERVTEALRRGLMYVQNQLREKDWKNLGLGGDTFSQAAVLRALAETPLADYRWSRQGVEVLLARMNPDGSWGDGPGTPGNVESTALCLLALVAAGQTRFVPARLARTALMDVQSQLSQITEERDRLRQDFESRVDEVSNNIVQQRNDLLGENQNLRQRLQATQDEIKQAREAKEAAEFRRAALEQERALLQRYVTAATTSEVTIEIGSFRFALPQFIKFIAEVLFPSLFIGGLGWLFLQSPTQTWLKVLGIIIISIAGLGFIGNYLSLRRRSLGTEPNAPAPVSDVSLLRKTYADMAAGWSPDVLEEIAYRLFHDLTDMSPDVAIRYTEDLATKLQMPAEQKAGLLSWVGQVTRLDASQRRLLFSQLQRSILGS
jgi:Prenyltransferase and squalene oxidase repeat